MMKGAKLLIHNTDPVFNL